MQDAPKLKASIVGSGLAGLSTAVELLDQGYEVDIYESRPFIGGKVASWQKDGNHVEMGLHVVSNLACLGYTSSHAVHVQPTFKCPLCIASLSFSTRCCSRRWACVLQCNQ